MTSKMLKINLLFPKTNKNLFLTKLLLIRSVSNQNKKETNLYFSKGNHKRLNNSPNLKIFTEIKRSL